MADTKISELTAHSPVVDTDEIIVNDIAGPTTKRATVANIRMDGVEAGITANVTQAQGDTPLTKIINEISVCANAGDSVTLPTAIAGLRCIVINNGAQGLGIWPATGDDLGTGVDTVRGNLAAGSNLIFVAYDVTNWEEI